eukprot:Unigene2977_Nuclearia_a/m.9157 Unigene2977_Nuclearia_a/g.9157  ORF Unigene2977_Nuclearia_a/g.9157 Unigene2977_Nuclearia_a/m.9157 type:complete len:115 (+) Unigene2977_Nuclearia_a:18-362(+)
MSRDRRTTLYVAGIGADLEANEVRREFERFGRIVRCDTPYTARGPKGFCFVEYEDERDAEDALRAMENGRIGHIRLNVQVRAAAPRERASTSAAHEHALALTRRAPRPPTSAVL